MPGPEPIKDGCLSGGNVDAYGGVAEIRRMVMGTMPEEFGPVAESYKSTSKLLTDTIESLRESAVRLVADGNWGGESARAMLSRMSRLQAYLQALRGEVDRVPPSLERVSRELAVAREAFDKATEQETMYVDAGMGGGVVPVGDPDEDARRFMRTLNGHFQEAYEAMPERLPWDAELASPVPYMPPPERAPSEPQGDRLQFEDTMPIRQARTDLAGTAGYQPPAASPAQAAAPPGGSPAAVPLPTPPLGNASLTGVSTAGGPPSGTANGLLPGTPPPDIPTAGAPTPGGAAPGRGVQPHAGVPPTVATSPPPGQNRSPSRLAGPAAGAPHDPYATSRAAADTGPSVRPGSVPVVDGSWPATRPIAGGGEPGPTAAGGAPFMPMGGMAPHEGQAGGRSKARKGGDDDFFRPAADGGPPVVG